MGTTPYSRDLETAAEELKNLGALRAGIRHHADKIWSPCSWTGFLGAGFHHISHFRGSELKHHESCAMMFSACWWIGGVCDDPSCFGCPFG